ncbi:MAG: aldo/keto reductase [Dehalococcoidia bacterium]
MEYRQIGSSEFKATAIGVGGYPFGPPFLDQADTSLVVDAAIDAGLNFFDTSDVYGSGKSEEQLGAALKGKRDRVMVATKFNLRNLDGQTAKERIFARCDEALRKLRTDYIDLFQAHHATPHVPHEELLEPLTELVRMGKVRAIGNGNTASWRLHEELAVSWENDFASFVSTQNHYSLLHRHPEVELMPFCRAHNVSLLPYFPLGGGWLTGTYRPGEPPPPDSRAAKAPTGIVTRLRSPRVDSIVPRLEAFAQERGRTIYELALAWVLSHPEVAVALVGFDKPEHVHANLRALEWKLTPEERAELDAITNWWDGGAAVVDSDGPAPRPANG